MTATTSIRLKLADIGGLDEGKPQGTNRRFNCPIHGGDSYTLSIVDEGDRIGTGHCHNAICAGNRQTVVILDYPGRTNVAHTPLDYNARAKALLTPRIPKVTHLEAHAMNELETLHSWQQRMQDRLSDEKPAAYLASRGISREIAEIASAGYIPDTTLPISDKWRDRIIFPLWHPDGGGYVGRSLHGWVEGMNEAQHKVVLPDGMRYQKTGRAGWYGVAAHELASTVFIVEGTFDRLALLANGADTNEVIALCGSSLNVEWLPNHVDTVILALDLDEAGRTASSELEKTLRIAGIHVAIAESDDTIGKDASERHRNAIDGLWYIFNAWDTVTGVLERPMISFDVQLSPTIEPSTIELPITPHVRLATVTTNCYYCNPSRVEFTLHDVVGNIGTCRGCKHEREIGDIPDYANMPITCKAPVC